MLNEVNDETKVSLGLAATIFKIRFGNQKKKKKDFNHRQHSKTTELSKYIWSLKDAKISYSIKWSIVEKVHGRTKIDRYTSRLAEKLHLITLIFGY